MQIGADQGALLKLLVRAVDARRAVEIGTFTGYSALVVAAALPADGKLVCCDISDEWTRIGKRYWEEAGVAARIDLRLGPALKTLETLLREYGAGSFDFAFIDADKSNYSNYYERALVLLRPGGVIATDNVLWDGSVIDPGDHSVDTEAIRNFNLKLHGDSRVALSMVPLGDGLTLACKL
jgi:predicted O-methyltransferase YrrM